MKNLSQLLAVLLCTFIIACGGGSSGPKQPSISINKNQINLVSEFNQVITERITVKFDGDGVIVGLPAGESELPSWLEVSEVSSTNSSAVFELSMFAPNYEGNYGTTLRFVTGRSADNTIVSTDLNIVLTAISPIAFSAISGQGEMPAAQEILMSASQRSSGYTAEVNYLTGETSWLNINSAGTTYNAQIASSDLAPGQYQATIVLTDNASSTISRTVLYSIEEPSVEIATVENVNINNSTRTEDINGTTTVTSNSDSVTWQVSSTSDLISAVGDNNSGSIDFNIVPEELAVADNGTHEAWVEIVYDHPYANEPKTLRATFHISLSISEIKYLTPRVKYSNEEQEIIIWGHGLDQIEDEQILEENPAITSFTRVSDNELKASLQANLQDGDYQIGVSNNLGLNREQAKLVVKPRPSFPVADLTLPMRAFEVIYDAERERFYYSGDFSGSAVYAISHNGTEWQWSQYPIQSPGGITLTRDAKKLIVGTYNCDVFEIALETNRIAEPSPPNSCYYEEYGFVAQFYNGMTVVADTDQWPGMWTYPDWGNTPFSLPSEHTPVAKLSANGTHMIWAGAPTTTGSRTAYIYDAQANVMNVLGTLGGDYYLGTLFSISGSGERISHYNDIYSEQLAYIGSLGNYSRDSLDRVGISHDGSIAALYQYGNKSIKVYDISSTGGNFPELNYNFSLNAEMLSVDRIVFSEDNKYMFVFANNYQTNISKMYVYKL